MQRKHYEAQVELIVRTFPYVAKEKIFALKGGTAINLFYRNLPRLSVDIDLTYLPIKSRTESLTEIDNAMNRIAAAIENNILGARIRRLKGGGDIASRFGVCLDGAEIKVETSPVARGVVHDTAVRHVSDAVEEKFGYEVMRTVAFEDLFAGKMNAALDRQHPRDLYDVKLLYENEGLTEDLFHTFLVYVASSGRPPHELLNPNLIDISNLYSQEFEAMAYTPVSCEDLLKTRTRLINDIQSRFDENTERFFLSLHDGMPDFDAINRPQAATLPAVQWKLINLEKLKKNNPDKHAMQRGLLEDLFCGVQQTSTCTQ